MVARTTPTSENGGEQDSGLHDKRYLRTLFAVYLTLLFTAFAVAVWAQSVERDFATAVTAVGAVFLLVPAMEAVAKRDGHNATLHRLAFLKGFGVAVTLAAVAWLALAALPVDVTDRSELKKARLLTGETAQLVVDAKPGRHDELSVTLEVQEEDQERKSPCLPGSALKFAGEDLARHGSVEADDEVTKVLVLDAAGPGVTVDITLLADDPYCQVKLVRKQASYR
jgi:hypothetical protein